MIAADAARGAPERSPALRVAFAIVKAIVVAGLLVAGATARVIAAGEGEIAASTAALRAGDPHEAVVRARRAAGWYAPGAPHVRVAYERLAALGKAAEGLGDVDTALLAWRAIRSAAHETRWIVMPHAADAERADQAIARLSAAGSTAPALRGEPASRIQREHLELLARDDGPRAPWIAVLAAGLAAWIGGAVWTVRRGIGPTGRIAWRAALPGAVATTLGLAAYLLAIWRA